MDTWNKITLLMKQGSLQSVLTDSRLKKLYGQFRFKSETRGVFDIITIEARAERYNNNSDLTSAREKLLMIIDNLYMGMHNQNKTHGQRSENTNKDSKLLIRRELFENDDNLIQMISKYGTNLHEVRRNYSNPWQYVQCKPHEHRAKETVLKYIERTDMQKPEQSLPPASDTALNAQRFQVPHTKKSSENIEIKRKSDNILEPLHAVSNMPNVEGNNTRIFPNETPKARAMNDTICKQSSVYVDTNNDKHFSILTNDKLNVDWSLPSEHRHKHAETKKGDTAKAMLKTHTGVGSELQSWQNAASQNMNLENIMCVSCPETTKAPSQAYDDDSVHGNSDICNNCSNSRPTLSENVLISNARVFQKGFSSDNESEKPVETLFTDNSRNESKGSSVQGATHCLQNESNPPPRYRTCQCSKPVTESDVSLNALNFQRASSLDIIES